MQKEQKPKLTADEWCQKWQGHDYQELPEEAEDENRQVDWIGYWPAVNSYGKILGYATEGERHLLTEDSYAMIEKMTEAEVRAELLDYYVSWLQGKWHGTLYLRSDYVGEIKPDEHSHEIVLKYDAEKYSQDVPAEYMDECTACAEAFPCPTHLQEIAEVYTDEAMLTWANDKDW